MEEIKKLLRKNIVASMKKEDIPGLAISLIDKNGIIWTEGFGFIDRSKSRIVDPDTIFSIGSTTKSITAVAFLRAVQKGIIKLDDKLITYYPEVIINSRYDDDQISKISFRHLLSHKAGLSGAAPMRGLGYDNTEVDFTFEDRIKSISDTWLAWPVDKVWYYSNPGFDLVAYVLQRISGKNYPEYVKEEVSKPLKMKSMVYGKKKGRENPSYAVGYTGSFEALFSDIYILGCAGIYISVRDLSNFVLFQLNNGTFDGKRILRRELLDEMRKIQSIRTDTVKYGLGLFINTGRFGGIRIYEHDGGGHGYRSSMSFNLEHGVGAIVLTNQGYCNPQKIADKALKLLFETKGVIISDKETPLVSRPLQMISKMHKWKNGKFGPNKPEWEKYIGLYRAYSYGNPFYIGIGLEFGYLIHIYAWSGARIVMDLQEYSPGVLFLPGNEAVIFKDNKMIFTAFITTRVENIVNEIKQLAEKDPNDRNLQIWVLNHIVFILQRLNRKDEALEIQKINYSLNPDDIPILISLSELYYKNENFKEVKEFCEKILKKESKNTKALDLLSKIEK
ncbi:MAG: serine hydrolase [Promethearchaeota archaeon]|jgi:CubicO group peptidase (beta-lactamase class C family)